MQHRTALGSVSFGQAADGCVYAGPALSAVIDDADPAVLGLVRPYAERRVAAQSLPWADAVGRVLAADPGIPRIGDVARRLAVSVRTLQVRLAEEDRRFIHLVEAVQRERALALLADPALTISSVAARTGFSTPAAFVRAFRRWTGRTPSEWRRS